MKEKLEKKILEKVRRFFGTYCRKIFFKELKCKISIYSVLERRQRTTLHGVFLKWFL